MSVIKTINRMVMESSGWQKMSHEELDDVLAEMEA